MGCTGSKAAKDAVVTNDQTPKEANVTVASSTTTSSEKPVTTDVKEEKPVETQVASNVANVSSEEVRFMF